MRTGIRFVYITALGAAFLGLAAPGVEAANPLLPDRDFCRTSSFGSWRFGHLHAGIDLSTGGVEGAPVAAIDSCWVWRVSVRHEGYGRALYVRLPDGKIAVYGHLSAFAPGIEEAVEREQDLRGSYEVDIYNDPYAVNFGKGDIIAVSGGSGWGPPHLHFELRHV
jgi:murein DD-endopeptidase MepM/ murein hydrolase activator NlpD